MKDRRFSVVKGIAIPLGAVCLLLAFFHVLFSKVSHDPPVIIVGGSVHGSAGKGGWLPNTKTGQEYSSASPDSTVIYAIDVYENGTPVTLLNPKGSGWEVNFHDVQDPNNNGVEVCSAQDCGNTSDGRTVYLKATGTTILERVSHSNIHFHDQNCYNSAGSANDCDHIDHLGFSSPPNTAEETKYQCGKGNGETCTICVGGTLTECQNEPTK